MTEQEAQVEDVEATLERVEEMEAELKKDNEVQPAELEEEDAEIYQYNVLLSNGTVLPVFDSEDIDAVRKRLNAAAHAAAKKRGDLFIRFPNEDRLTVNAKESKAKAALELDLPTHVLRWDLILDVCYDPDGQLLDKLLDDEEEDDDEDEETMELGGAPASRPVRLPPGA